MLVNWTPSQVDQAGAGFFERPDFFDSDDLSDSFFAIRSAMSMRLEQAAEVPVTGVPVPVAVAADRRRPAEGSVRIAVAQGHPAPVGELEYHSQMAYRFSQLLDRIRRREESERFGFRGFMTPMGDTEAEQPGAEEDQDSEPGWDSARHGQLPPSLIVSRRVATLD
jgi:hypothetical protein